VVVPLPGTPGPQGSGGQDGGAPQAAVAVAVHPLDRFFCDTVEGEIASGSHVLAWLLAAPGGAGGHIPLFSSISNFHEAKKVAKLLGFSSGEDCWGMVGVRTDASAPLAGDLEKRRSLLRLVFSAADTHGWPGDQRAMGVAYVAEIERALGECLSGLRELTKRLRKKKAGLSLVPTWQEPSAVLFHFATHHTVGETVSALHLSNLHGMDLVSAGLARVGAGQLPKVLSIQDTRQLYIALSQSQPKIEEALSEFKDCTVLIWEPEGPESISKIVSVVRSLYTKKNIKVAVQFLIPFVPLPECENPETILDLWTHKLLYEKNCVSDVCFIQEASRIVMTRDNNPIHVVKNVVAVTVRAEAPPSAPRMLSMRSVLLDEPVQGTRLLIDGPSVGIHTIWSVVHAMGLDNGAGSAVVWSLERRSRAHSQAQSRNVLVGQMLTRGLLMVKFNVMAIKNNLGDRGADCFVGHSSMYADNTNLLMEGTLPQILALQKHVAECVAVSPNRALFYPTSPEATFQNEVTNTWLQSVRMRYRSSGPMKGSQFATPGALPSHLAAQRRRTWIAHLPSGRASLLEQQLIIEVLDLEAKNYERLPDLIMDKIKGSVYGGRLLDKVEDQYDELGIHQWRAVFKDDAWSGKILLQCDSVAEVRSLYGLLQGTVICIGGLRKTIEISSPTDVSLPAGPLDVASNVPRASQPQGVGT
jgi:hypothetical protein